MSTDNLDDLTEFFDECLHELVANPWHAGRRLLTVCCDTFEARAGRLLSLSAQSGLLEIMAEYDSGNGVGVIPEYEPVSPAAYSSDPVDFEEGVLIRMPARRSNAIVGSIEVVLDPDSVLPPKLSSAFSRLVPLVRANHALRSGLQVLPPIPDISGDQDEFGSRVYHYLDAHTQARLIAVYLVNSEWTAELTFAPDDPTVRAVLSESEITDEVVEACLKVPDAQQRENPSVKLLDLLGIEAVTIVARPTQGGAPNLADTVDDSTYALLLGFPLRYDPSPAEIAVFKHSLDVAAYLNELYVDLHRVVADAGAITQIGSAITGLETSQMVRHHAKTQIELAQNLVAEMQTSPKAVKEHLATLSTAVNEVALDLQRIKEASKAPSSEVVSTSLKTMWDTACSQVRWRLARRRIAIRYDGPDVDVVAAPDWFRQVFLNLLLNSADAYDSAERRSGKITLVVKPFGQSSETVGITYSDDATGILPQHFLSCDVAETVELSERVFRPGVTSKSQGSGWGLYVCRNIVSRTPGASIALGQSRGGTVFELTMKRARATGGDRR